MVGIILALIFRAIFIAAGYTLIENFSWVFYIFGAFLVYTALKLVQSYRQTTTRSTRRRTPSSPSRATGSTSVRTSTASSCGTASRASATSRRCSS